MENLSTAEIRMSNMEKWEKQKKKTFQINRRTLPVEFDKGVGVLIPLKYEDLNNK